jgi:pectinesterase inhibitor-like protein
MAALSPPLLVPILAVLLATAATTQCHADKHQSHAAKAAFAPPATVHAICHTTPHPASCLASAAVHLDAAHTAASSVAVTLLPASILSVALASLRGALTAVSSLSPVLSSTLTAPPTTLRRGAAQDCLELHAATLESLSRSTSLLTSPGESLPAVRAHLSAALTNKATCLDGLAGASGPTMDGLLSSLDDAYAHVSNSLSLVARRGAGGPASSSFQATVAKIIHHNRRLLQDDDEEEDSDENNEGGDDDDSGNGDGNGSGETVITVAKDGTGNFRTVGEAVAAVPTRSDSRTVIRVKAGTYEENVEVPADKTNIALVGEGRDVTVITGSRSAAGGWTTFRTATVGKSQAIRTSYN